MSFDIKNESEIFQHYINDILMEYLDDFCTAYLDDILIYSEDPLQHEEHIHKVFLQLCKAGLQANIKKCKFNITCMKYLSFFISTDGVQVDPKKVKAIHNWKQPTSI